MRLAILAVCGLIGCAHGPAPIADPLARELTTLPLDAGEPETQVAYDNTISNELSYLDVAPDLVNRVARGRAYVGVGPEQNLAYIALARPAIAFIVDYRRDNLLLHVAYRALFDLARGRVEFLTALLGRSFEVEAAPDDGIEIVIAAATARPPSVRAMQRTRDAVVARARAYDLGLDGRDLGRMVAQLDVLFDRQLDGRPPPDPGAAAQPSLRELLTARSLDGTALGFLAREDHFRVVRSLERAGHVVPIVGDFAGDRALRRVGAWLHAHALTVGVFYVSNVEEALDAAARRRFVGNARALPWDERSLAIRAVVPANARSVTTLVPYATIVSD